MNKKGLFIGLTTVDIQYFVDEYPIANTKVKTNSPYVAAGGPAANAAITYAFMGGNADLLSCIGQNAFRELLIEDFRKGSVNVIDFCEKDDFQPIVATVITSLSNSDRTIITHHPEALKKQMTKSIVNIKDYDFVFIDGFYPELAMPLCKQAKKEGVDVIFDGGSWKPQLPELIPFIDITICSNNFFPPDCKTDEDVLLYMKQKGVRHIAISRGENDIVTELEDIEIEKIKAIDSLGAGDVLHGAFCWFWNNNINFIESLKRASKVATFSTLSKGTRNWMDTYKI